MPKTVNERLRRVGDRLAKIDRRLGYLVIRVYARKQGTDIPLRQEYAWEELSVWDCAFSPAATNGDGQSFISEKSETAFSVKLNKDWEVANRAIAPYLQYAISQNNGVDKNYCSFVELVAQDKETFASLSLRSMQFSPMGLS